MEKRRELHLPPPVVDRQYQMRAATFAKVTVRQIENGMVTVNDEASGDWEPMSLLAFWQLYEPEAQHRAQEEQSWKVFFEASNPSLETDLKLISLVAQLLSTVHPTS